MTKQPEAWLMGQMMGESDHERLKRLYDAVINEGGEDCLMSRVNRLEYDMASIRSHKKWLMGVLAAVAADLLLRLFNVHIPWLK